MHPLEQEKLASSTQGTRRWTAPLIDEHCACPQHSISLTSPSSHLTLMFTFQTWLVLKVSAATLLLYPTLKFLRGLSIYSPLRLPPPLPVSAFPLCHHGGSSLTPRCPCLPRPSYRKSQWPCLRDALGSPVALTVTQSARVGPPVGFSSAYSRAPPAGCAGLLPPLSFPTSEPTFCLLLSHRPPFPPTSHSWALIYSKLSTVLEMTVLFLA